MARLDRFTDGLLTPTETASHLEVPLSTLSGWLKETAADSPLVHHVEPERDGQPSIPFIGLAEAHVLRSWRLLGLRTSEIRDAATALRKAFGTPYGLVSKRITTDGVDILVKHGRELLADHLQYLTWEGDDDYPTSLRLKQYGKSVPVVIDPRFGHGLPVIAANRVPVQAVSDLREAGESVEEIAYEYDMTAEQVDSLCHAVERLGGLAPRKQDRDRLRELVDWLEEEHGPVTEFESAAAQQELRELDAEHARLRSAAKGRKGEVQ